MEHEQFTEAAVAEIVRMADTARGADVETPISTCPGWDLRQLIRHTGTVHRWATALVASRATERIDIKSLDKRFPDDSGWPDWLASGADPLADALRGISGDEPMWAWGADQHARFWSRRQLHETVVHHADAQMALGLVPSVEPNVAIDGIDEMLENSFTARYVGPDGAGLSGVGDTLHFHATDGDGEWMLELAADGYSWTHGHGKGTVAVRATATDLLLGLYGRCPISDDRFEVFGNRALLETWIAKAAL